MRGKPEASILRSADRRRLLGLYGFSLIICVTLIGGGVAWAKFSGSVANSVGTFSSGTMLLTGTTPISVSCTSSSTINPITTNTAICSGDPVPAGTLTTSSSNASSTFSDPGTVSPTSATIASTNCGVQELVDSTSTNDTGLTFGGAAYQQTGPISGSAIALSGGTGRFETTVSYSTSTGFSLLAWFKVASGATGTIFSVSNSQFTTGASSSDLNLWVNASGKLVWGVVTLGKAGAQTKSEVTSAATVTNNSWHFVAATFGGLTSTLYLDGSSAGSVSGLTGILASTGYVSIGWGAEGATSWTGPPTSAFLTGSLSMVSISPATITGSQVTTLNGETSATNYETALTSSLAPSENWQMNDTGAVAYTGAVNLSAGGTATPCQRVEVTVQQVQSGVTTCAAPSGVSACPAPANPPLLSSLSTAAAVDDPTTAASVALTITMKLTAASPAGLLGLHLLPGITFSAARPSWTAGLTYSSASVAI